MFSKNYFTRVKKIKINSVKFVGFLYYFLHISSTHIYKIGGRVIYSRNTANLYHGAPILVYVNFH